MGTVYGFPGWHEQFALVHIAPGGIECTSHLGRGQSGLAHSHNGCRLDHNGTDRYAISAALSSLL